MPSARPGLRIVYGAANTGLVTITGTQITLTSQGGGGPEGTHSDER